ncbi:MAG: ABC transporter permease, partial [Pseudomonadales bacterium]|nr:ABC transporter permease [Pseudomonadales bacterium]
FILQALQLELPMFQRPEVDFRAAVTALLLLVGIGTVAGLVPAMKAARITPIEAMRA